MAITMASHLFSQAPANNASDPIASFFAYYGYPYNYNMPVSRQFCTMCEYFGWLAGSDGLKAARTDLGAAVKEKKAFTARDREQGFLQHESHTTARTNNPLAAFFKSYHCPYNPNLPLMNQFFGMCTSLGWDQPRSPERNQARMKLNAAISKAFNSWYGARIDRLQIWQDFCIEVYIPPPPTIEECKIAALGVYVNIIDLLDFRTTGDPVEPFDTEYELAAYSRESKKIFPHDEANAGNLLKYLLRRILTPIPGPRKIPTYVPPVQDQDVQEAFEQYMVENYRKQCIEVLTRRLVPQVEDDYVDDSAFDQCMVEAHRKQCINVLSRRLAVT